MADEAIWWNSCVWNCQYLVMSHETVRTASKAWWNCSNKWAKQIKKKKRKENHLETHACSNKAYLEYTNKAVRLNVRRWNSCSFSHPLWLICWNCLDTLSNVASVWQLFQETSQLYCVSAKGRNSAKTFHSCSAASVLCQVIGQHHQNEKVFCHY